MIPWKKHQQLSTLRFPSSEPVSDVPGRAMVEGKYPEKHQVGAPSKSWRGCASWKIAYVMFMYCFFGGSTLATNRSLGKVQCLQYFLLMYQVVFMLFMAISVCANWLGVLLGVLSHVVSISRMYWQKTQWKRDLNAWVFLLTKPGANKYTQLVMGCLGRT